jgi:Uma2 family endonuclease
MTMLAQLSRVEVAEWMTAVEFFAVAPDDQKAELINGVLIVSPSPLDVHERENLFLLRLIGEYVEQHGLGEVRGSRTAVRLTDSHVFQPDVLFVCRDRDHIIEERGVFGAPDLVIEILSMATAQYDRGVKFQTYQQTGVRELWLIDPYGPAGTEFFQRQGDTLAPVMADEKGWLNALVLPGFRLQLSWLWPNEKFITIQEALAAMV